MSEPRSAVAATEQAIDLIEKLKTRFGSLMFVQSEDCSEGSSPMCVNESDFTLGPEDLLVGEIDGCYYYVDDEMFERSGSPNLVIDCVPGAADSFSIEGTFGMHFVTHPK